MNLARKGNIKEIQSHKMEINSISLFLVGIVVVILGIFVVVFDYPQIQYFENMESKSYLMLEGERKDIHQRLKIEFSIGVGIILTGIAFLIFSIFRKPKS